LTGYNFAALLAMMMGSGSFESPKTYPFALHLMKSVAALLSYVIFAQNNLIYVVMLCTFFVMAVITLSKSIYIFEIFK